MMRSVMLWALVCSSARCRAAYSWRAVSSSSSGKRAPISAPPRCFVAPRTDRDGDLVFSTTLGSADVSDPRLQLGEIHESAGFVQGETKDPGDERVVT